MHIRIFILWFLSLFAVCRSNGQCTTLGQNPGTAFPVCGTTVFNQTTVPICGSTDLYVPGCVDGALYQNKNPYWYKFTCYQTGTLGFVITPLDLGEDYDWQLYDVTGRDPNDVYTDPSLVVTGNWAGTYGLTGASSTGVNFIQCSSSPDDLLNAFAAMPRLIAGHNYLLLISHFTDSQSGYGLSFEGGTAIITDPKLPALLDGEAACDALKIRIRLNKKMTCKSLAADGSDFIINTTSTNIIAASNIQCSTGFDMDSVLLTLNRPMPPGTFTVTIRNGADGNTLLDNCGRNIPPGDQVSFTVYPLIPTPFDSITQVKCAPRQLELVFRKGILCNSIAKDGSDFLLTGPSAISVTGAEGVACTNGISKKILVTLSGPVQVGGIYRLTLVNGSDRNTIFDECSQQTPAGSAVEINVRDTVNADFTFSIVYGCEKNVVQYNYANRNMVNSWRWTFDDSVMSSLQNPVINYADYRIKKSQLIVSNGVCRDTSAQSIFFDNLIVSDFEISNVVCPNEPAKILNKTIGRIVEWNWSYGNGATGTLKNPAPQIYPPRISSDYIAVARLIVKNDYGCYDTSNRALKVVFSCFIAVRTAFTPNGDGLNDYLYPLSAYKSTDMHFTVYNRFGQAVFSSTNWTDKWDGRFKGQGADAGTYVWVLSYLNTDTNQRVEQKGSTILIR